MTHVLLGLRGAGGRARVLLGVGEITAVFVGEQDGKPKPNGKGQC